MKSVDLLSRAVERNQLTHAYLAPVKSGTDLSRYAAELAGTILCPPDDGKCRQRVASNTHPDFLPVRVLNDKRKISINQVDEVISSSAYSPVEGERKVYVINRAEDLSREGSNSLLKILEDPPEFVYFLLLTESPGSLLPTVISRCQRLPKGGTSTEGLRHLLSTQGFDREEVSYLLKVANGKANLVHEILEGNLQSPLKERDQALSRYEDSDLRSLSRDFVEGQNYVKRDVLAGLIFEEIERAGNFQLMVSAGELSELSQEELTWFFEKGLRLYRERYRKGGSDDEGQEEGRKRRANLSRAKSIDRAIVALKTNANVQLLMESLWLQLASTAGTLDGLRSDRGRLAGPPGP